MTHNANESRAARRHSYARAIRGASSLDAAAQILEMAVSAERESAAHLLEEVRGLSVFDYPNLLEWALRRTPPPRRGLATLGATELLSLRRHALIGWLALAAESAWEQGRQLEASEVWGAVQTATLRLVGADAVLVALTDPRGDGHVEEETKQS